MPLLRPNLQDLRDRINITWGYLRRQMAGTDVVPRSTGLRQEQLKELQSLLAERFGTTNTLDGADAARRERIVTRGRIRTADEYRLISVRVEAIYADSAHRDELEALNRLLADVAARRVKLPGD